MGRRIAYAPVGLAFFSFPEEGGSFATLSLPTLINANSISTRITPEGEFVSRFNRKIGWANHAFLLRDYSSSSTPFPDSSQLGLR